MTDSLHVLLVDDEEAIVYPFQRYLERAGYRVTPAYDGATAFGLSRHDPVDALITDYRMPGMNGLDLLRRMRESQPDLPAIIVTGYGSEIDFGKTQAKVLSKPVDPTALVLCLKGVIDDARTAANFGTRQDDSGRA